MIKKIIGYESYMTDDYGNITNLDGRNMAYSIDRDGYKRITLRADDGVKRCLGIHRIVYGTFNNIEISSIGVLDHIDIDKTNNHIENLREVSWSQSNINKKTRKVYIAIGIVSRKIYQFDNLDLAKSYVGIDNYKPNDIINISCNHIIFVEELDSTDAVSYFKEIDYDFDEIARSVVDKIDMSKQKFKQICPKIATNKKLGKTYIYRNNSEFAKFLGGVLMSVQGAILKNTKTYKGYEIDYLPFFHKASLEISEVISTTTP